MCRQRGSKQQHQRKLFFKRSCQRLAKLRLQRIFQQWAHLMGSKLHKLANATHIASHHRHSLQVGLCILSIYVSIDLYVLSVSACDVHKFVYVSGL